MFRRLPLLLALVALLAGVASAQTFQEIYRPQVHFTPAQNWMNDPNGPIWFDGEYHLFYQYNPFGRTWGHMSWGHAVSPDMVHWRELPVAIPELGDEQAWSGTVVFDAANTSGLGTAEQPPLVAVYTAARPGHQAQALAYSTDRGRTWTRYAGNPVLDIGSPEFRDPRVFWHEPSGQWVMAVTLPVQRRVAFYTSPDLIRWTHRSTFGPAGATGGIWEMPDLFELAVDGDSGRKRWVLVVGLVGADAVAGGSGGQYFLGDFDGERFTAEPRPEPTVPEGRLIGDFEGSGWGDWTVVSGTAFGPGPARGTLPGQQPVTGYLGAGLANSYHGGDGPTGVLRSPAFTVTHDYLNLLVGGGDSPQTAAVLLVDGEEVRRASGQRTETLDWVAWDVRAFRGREATVEVRDLASGGWGHILVDHVVLSDEPATRRSDTHRWVDFGPDFYASLSYNDVPDGRRIWHGWTSNWTYAGALPTSPWRGAQSLPRELGLKTFTDGVHLVQQPAAEVAALREAPVALAGIDLDGEVRTLPLTARQVEIEATFAVGTAEEVGLHVRVGEARGEVTVVGVDVGAGRAFLDRRSAGYHGFSDSFAGRFDGPLPVEDGTVTLRVVVDESIVEAFYGGGRTPITAQVFPRSTSDGLAVYARGGTAELVSLTAWPLASIWSGGTSAAPTEAPLPELRLGAPWPNPSDRPVRLPLFLPEPGPVRVAVFDTLGREVAVLLDEELPAGSHEATWSGLDAGRQRAAPGVYLVRVTAGEATRTRRVTLLR
jgi:sucrose-6-phosphate hydrolase SacC (GH32 family)